MLVLQYGRRRVVCPTCDNGNDGGRRPGAGMMRTLPCPSSVIVGRPATRIVIVIVIIVVVIVATVAKAVVIVVVVPAG